jgi:hypothetical protein
MGPYARSPSPPIDYSPRKPLPLTSSTQKMFDMYSEDALKHFKRHNLGSVHIAILIKNKKVVAVAANRIGSRSCGSGYSRFSLHAEKAVVKELGDISLLRGCSMIVFRIMKGTHEISYSEPCHSCKCFLEKAQKEYGLRRVIHS